MGRPKARRRPWSEAKAQLRKVAIHEAVDKADGVVFRCTLSGSAADRWLEVPAWMFDRARCLDPSRLTASPFWYADRPDGASDPGTRSDQQPGLTDGGRS